MNYSLDALWWELKTDAVRDLASLLTAPSLWQTNCELSRRALLGDTGFRYLLALDDQPDVLHQYLQAASRQSHRLGFYAEHLLAFWFAHAPHCQLLGQNVVLQEAAHTPTIGALDYVTRINDTLYHLELTCKYYAHSSADPQGLRGIQAKDTLASKAAKLTQQLALHEHPVFAAWCEAHQIQQADLQAASVVRGMGFWLGDAVQSPINPYAWRGEYLENQAAWPHIEGCRYAAIPSKRLLSPLRLPTEATLAQAQEGSENSVWWAQLQQRPDGHWHEVSRSMCLQNA